MVREIEDLKRTVRENAASSTLEASSIGAGGLQIINGGSVKVIDPATGNVVAFFGQSSIPDGSGRTQMVAYLFRDDGSAAFQLGDLGTTPGHTHQQALQWFDRSGNVTFADDTSSAQGLARPYIPLGVFTDTTVPTATTTSTTFTTLQSLGGYKQHPKLLLQVLVYADTGTTGVVQIVDQAANVLGTTTLTSGQFSYVNFGPVVLAGTHEQAIGLSIQGKVTSGAGKVGARGTLAMGVQS